MYRSTLILLRSFGLYPFEIKNNLHKCSKKYYYYSLFLLMLPYAIVMSVRIVNFTINLRLEPSSRFIYDVAIKFEPSFNNIYLLIVFKPLFSKKYLIKLQKGIRYLDDISSENNSKQKILFVYTIVKLIFLWILAYLRQIIVPSEEIGPQLDLFCTLIESTLIILTQLYFCTLLYSLFDATKTLLEGILTINKNCLSENFIDKYQLWIVINNYNKITKLQAILLKTYGFPFKYLNYHCIFNIMVMFKRCQMFNARTSLQNTNLLIEDTFIIWWCSINVPLLMLMMHLGEKITNQVSI